MIKQWILLAAIVALCAAPVRSEGTKPGEDSPPPNQTTTNPPPPTKAPNKGAQAQIDKLAAEFNVPASEITALRAQKLGWGEIRHALAISQKAGVPVGDVLKLRQSGMGWGKIAQKYGFKLGDVAGKGKSSQAGTTTTGDNDHRGPDSSGADRDDGAHGHSQQGFENGAHGGPGGHGGGGGPRH